jgi:SAM-dependent methyltransferase
MRERTRNRFKYAHFPYVHQALTDASQQSESPFRILDVGCGPGNLPAFCGVPHGCEWFGLDLWEHELRQAQEQAPYKGLFQINLVDGLPFRDQCFGVIVCNEVLMYLPNAKEILDEFYRVLGPGGRIFIHNPITWFPQWSARLKNLVRRVYREKGAVALNRETDWRGARRVSRITYYSCESLVDTIRAANFRITDVRGFRLFRNRLRIMTRLEDYHWYRVLVRAVVGRYPNLATDLMVAGVKT